MKVHCLLVSALVASIVIGPQDDVQPNLAKLKPLIGRWKMHVRTYEPRELRVDANGVVSAKWSLNQRHVELTAKLKIDGKGDWEGRGFVSFDDDASYPKRAFRGYFLWGDDARLLSMAGGFSGNKLVLEGAPLILGESKQSSIRTTVIFTSRDRIDISIDFPAAPKERTSHMGDITLTRDQPSLRRSRGLARREAS